MPGLNSIAFADGSMILLDIKTYYDPNNHERTISCSPLCDTTITSIEQYDSDIWVIVDVWTSVDYQGGKIYGGDGQMGNEGFIACTDANGCLIWSMFWDETNPIKQLSIKDKMLTAINEHEELKIEINLDNLVDIKMTSIAKP